MKDDNNVFLDHVKEGMKEKDLYKQFYIWVNESLNYKYDPLDLIKGGKEKFDVALEYLKENERER